MAVLTWLFSAVIEHIAEVSAFKLKTTLRSIPTASSNERGLLDVSEEYKVVGRLPNANIETALKTGARIMLIKISVGKIGSAVCICLSISEKMEMLI